MQSPQVSIIVPIYNVESYLQECLQSICSQSYENLDLILIDDGSSDESLKLALEFAKKDERIFIISKPNAGLSSARNFGIELIKGSPLRILLEKQMKKQSLDEVKELHTLTKTHSFDNGTKTLDLNELLGHFKLKGKNFIQSDIAHINEFIIQTLPKDALIHFVDSDDYLDKDCIKLCVEDLIKNKADICIHNIQDFKDGTKEFKTNSYLNKVKKQSYNAGLELLVQNKIYDFYFSPQGLFKASLLNLYALRYTEGIYHEDHDFGTLLFCLANKISRIDKALYFYRQRLNSTMTSQKNTTFPKKLPYFLEPLRSDFGDYGELRAFYRDYCFVVVASKIWDFFKATQKQKRYFQKNLEKYTARYVVFHLKKDNFYSQNAKKLLNCMCMGGGLYRNLYIQRLYCLAKVIYKHPFNWRKKLRKKEFQHSNLY